MTANRAAVLNFAEYKSWPKWSLSVRLFWAFGPIGIPPQFTARNLPAVIILRKFCRPRMFLFGSFSKERPTELARLASELQL